MLLPLVAPPGGSPPEHLNWTESRFCKRMLSLHDVPRQASLGFRAVTTAEMKTACSWACTLLRMLPNSPCWFISVSVYTWNVKASMTYKESTRWRWIWRWEWGYGPFSSYQHQQKWLCRCDNSVQSRPKQPLMLSSLWILAGGIWLSFLGRSSSIWYSKRWDPGSKFCSPMGTKVHTPFWWRQTPCDCFRRKCRWWSCNAPDYGVWWWPRWLTF